MARRHPLTFDDLLQDARAVAVLLMARRQSLAVAESSTGGLISAALLAVPGASAFYLGGGVIYTPRARHRLLDLKREEVRGLRGATEAYAIVLADRAQSRFKARWAIGETGATGPAGNPYGDAPGHCCHAVAGPDGSTARTLETGDADRLHNMLLFSRTCLAHLHERIAATPA
ncbi:CinA family protein [Sandaracinobacter neustonicus]|nr:CinA family protein [Sandaracinobacter neustonicus]